MEFTISHVNLHVFDLERSLEFYEKALSLKEVRRHEAPDGSFKLVFISDPSMKCQVELTWNDGREAGYDLGENENHIAFATPDIEAARKLHGEMGIVTFENPGMGIYFISDPDGYELEIIPERR